MNPQVEGLDSLEGTYVFDLRASNRALKLNRFFWNMIQAEWRGRFNQDEETLMDEAGLTAEQKQLIRARDWIGLVRHGACFFVLEKWARVVKKTNLEVYALMRGETYDEFMATRQVPGAT